MEDGDEIGLRIITVDSNVYETRAHDPYGFWTVKCKGKKTPDELQGRFTTLNEAEKAIRGYAAKANGGDPDSKKLTKLNPKIDKDVRQV